MARGRPHDRSKSDQRVCQAARYANAAEYRERTSISAEQQEERIAAVNADCNVQDAPRRRRGQKSKDRKTKAFAARVSARGTSCRGSGSAKRKADKRLEHLLGKAAGRDPHTLHCHECGASAEFGLRGSKGGGEVRYFCKGHATSNGCFRLDKDRTDWAADREMRRLRAEEKRLEEELHNLGGTSSPAEPAAEQRSASPSASAPRNESRSTLDWVSMPRSRSLIVTLLMIGDIKGNPGPPSPAVLAAELEEIANCKKSWEEADLQISPTLLAHLAQLKVNFANWRKLSRGDRLEEIGEFKKAFEATEDGLKWAQGWTTTLKSAGAGSSGQPGPSALGTSQSAPQELVDFWRALPRAKWSDDGKIMTLAEGTSFLGHEGLSNTLYLRDCYPGLHKELNELFEEEDSHRKRKKNRAVAIIGNPGIGKSVFGYLLLYYWATEDPPREVVVVKRGYRTKATLLTTAGCFELDANALAEQLRRPEVRYLVDGLNPMDVGDLPTRAQMVLVTSPDPQIFHEAWKAEGYTRRYMDVWSWAEIDKCREDIYPDLVPDEVLARYDRWGGIPRYVLEKLQAVEQGLLKEAIDSTPLKTLVDSVGSPASPTEASHKLIHLRVTENFQTRVMKMASTYVAAEVAYRLWKNEQANLKLFLSASGGEGSIAALRGNLCQAG